MTERDRRQIDADLDAILADSDRSDVSHRIERLCGKDGAE